MPQGGRWPSFTLHIPSALSITLSWCRKSHCLEQLASTLPAVLFPRMCPSPLLHITPAPCFLMLPRLRSTQLWETAGHSRISLCLPPRKNQTALLCNKARALQPSWAPCLQNWSSTRPPIASCDGRKPTGLKIRYYCMSLFFYWTCTLQLHILHTILIPELFICTEMFVSTKNFIYNLFLWILMTIKNNYCMSKAINCSVLIISIASFMLNLAYLNCINNQWNISHTSFAHTNSDLFTKYNTLIDWTVSIDCKHNSHNRETTQARHCR